MRAIPPGVGGSGEAGGLEGNQVQSGKGKGGLGAEAKMNKKKRKINRDKGGPAIGA